VFNVNRKANATFWNPDEFMLRKRARAGGADRAVTRHQHSQPALLKAPAPAEGMRWALPGERPPSKFAAGQPDDVIERFDAYRAQWSAGKVKKDHGRRGRR
jgi:hypothetical protein